MSEGIAIVGLACRYPDARSPAELWETVVARRRAFRRIPDERLRLADYQAAAPGDPDGVALQEAAVLAGWEFDRVRFRIAGETFRATDLTHWLALEVAAEALADAGFAAGEHLPRDATGVLVGNSLTGEFARAHLLRLRWPYVRRVLAAGLAGEGWPDGRVGEFLDRLELSYKAPFPAPCEESLAGGLSNTIAGRICNHFDLHGGGFTVDGACASSLLAVTQSCSALIAGDLDVALAGGVDLSLDPFELVGFARAGALAAGEMRVYDRRSAGFTPGEGCGFAVLMRESDAAAQGRRIHALIRGWGVSSDGHGGISRPEAAGQRLALDRAYRRAGFGLDTVAYFEGHGTGTAVGDATELAALSQALRAAGALPGARGAAGAAAGRAAGGGGGDLGGRDAALPAIGTIKANIGHTKAAAGIAGLLKAVMAVASQTLPPTTGCDDPHPELTAPGATLRVLEAPEPWPAGRPLRAGVSAMGFGGVNAHVVVEGTATVRRSTLARRERGLAAPLQDAELFVLAASGRESLLARVRQLAATAARLSRAELGDLAAALARQMGAPQRDHAPASAAAPSPVPEDHAEGLRREAPAPHGPAAQDHRMEAAATVVAAGSREALGSGGARAAGSRAASGSAGARAAIVAGTPVELASRARQLASWIDEGVTSRLDQRQGMFLGLSAPDRAAGKPPRVGLLFTGQGSPTYGESLGGALRRRFAALAAIYDPPAGGAAIAEAALLGAPPPAADRATPAVREAVAHGGGSQSRPGAATTAVAAVHGGSLAPVPLESGGADGASADTAAAQPAIVSHSLAGLWLLERLGVQGSVAVGHSLGELAALSWAGGCGPAVAVRLAAARGRAMAERGEPGAMASLDASPAEAGAMLAGSGATIAAFNGARRTVISGAPEEVTALLARAAARGVEATRLKVARAFHSPRVAAAVEDLALALAEVAWRPLRRPVASTVSGELLAPDADLTALLLRQVTSPVRFTAAMAAARPLADLWVEVGPGRAVAELAGGIVGEPVLALDAGGPSLATAWSVAGALFAAGVPVDLAPLFAGRFTRPFDLDRPLVFLANPCESAPLPAAGRRTPAGVQSAGDRTLTGGQSAVRRAEEQVSRRRAPADGESASRCVPTGERNLPEAANLPPLALVRALVAARAELPESAVRDDSRLLSDLHLNSISVGQLVVDASRRLGLAPPVSPTDYAQSTVAQVAQALAERAGREAPEGAPADDGPEAGAGQVPGVDSWVRPFVIALRERPLRSPRPPAPSAAGAAPGAGAGAWQVIAPPGHPLAAPLAAALQSAAPAGSRPAILLCLPADLGGSLELFVTAARAATGGPAPSRFVVVQHQGGGGGFARTLRLELPATDTWVIDLPVDAGAERAASWVSAEVAAHHAAPAAASAAAGTAGPAGVVAQPPRPGSDRAEAGPGLYVEAHYDREGVRRVPVLRLVERTADAVPSGEPPAAPAPAGAPGGLGPHDVLLVTGGGKGIGAECALALARASGCRLAIVGRSDPAADRELAANLERLRANGVQPLYLRADVADRQAVAAAVERAAAELGPVTALLHAAGRNEPRRLADLDLAGLQRILAPKVAGAEHLLAALQDPRHGRLRLVVAFGSIIARTGLHGEADYALANEWLERRVARFAAAHPGCRCLVLEWSVWSGTGMGERLGTMEALRHQGIMPLPIDSGIAELLRLLADPAVAGSVIVAGRFGNPPTLEVERAALPLLRFLERPRVHFPGIELVADTEISAESDPYLADHVFRGEPLFAAVLGLEAMAQAAAAVTGARGLPVFENVELRRPIAVTPGRTTTIRLAALVRQPGLVEVALRDSSTGFATDHFRARCRFPAAAAEDDGERAGLSTARQTAAPVAAMAGVGTAAAGPAASGGLLALDPARDLYGGILFHAGRFRRLGGFRELRATECLAEIVPDGTVAWFGPYLPPALLLGDPAARDAAIHGIQACIPHAQLLPTGVERIFTGHVAADEPLLLSARERQRDGDLFVYDLDILAADGSVRERWQGLHLRAVDRTRLPAVWSAPLLAPYLERRLQELLADDRLRVTLEPTGIGGGDAQDAGAGPPARRGGRPAGAGGAAPRPLTSSARSRTRINTSPDMAAPATPPLLHRPDGRPEIPGGPPLSLAHAGGLTLAVILQEPGSHGPGPQSARLGCDLEPVAARTADTWHDLLGTDRFALAGLLARRQGESPDAAGSRVWAAAESLLKAGAPAGIPLLLDETGDDGWILLRAGDLRVATFTATLRELGGPVALAVAAADMSAGALASPAEKFALVG